MVAGFDCDLCKDVDYPGKVSIKTVETPVEEVVPLVVPAEETAPVAETTKGPVKKRKYAKKK